MTMVKVEIGKDSVIDNDDKWQWTETVTETEIKMTENSKRQNNGKVKHWKETREKRKEKSEWQLYKSKMKVTKDRKTET